MIESSMNLNEESLVPREERVNHIKTLIETLRVAEEVAQQGYLITSSELADLMDKLFVI